MVTGSSEGIGYAIAEKLLQQGCKVVISGRDQEKLSKAYEELKKISQDIFSIVGDVTKPEQANILVQKTIERFGSIDILVNNVGGVRAFKPFEEITDEEWMETFERNLFAAVRITRAVLPYMQKEKWGRIIAISSESAVQPDAVIPHYNAAKAALNAFMKSLSKAYGKDGILVNTVSPAFIMTPEIDLLTRKKAEQEGKTEQEVIKDFMQEHRPNIELKRPGTPEEVANVVAFVASELASFITGTNIRVDGGSVGTV